MIAAREYSFFCRCGEKVHRRPKIIKRVFFSSHKLILLSPFPLPYIHHMFHPQEGPTLPSFCQATFMWTVTASTVQWFSGVNYQSLSKKNPRILWCLHCFCWRNKAHECQITKNLKFSHFFFIWRCANKAEKHSSYSFLLFCCVCGFFEVQHKPTRWKRPKEKSFADLYKYLGRKNQSPGLSHSVFLRKDIEILLSL